VAPHARHRPASALKVLTALVTVRRLDPNAVVTGIATDQAIDGSKAGIGPGGQYTVRQLLAGLLLNSGNDTAAALARAAGGDAAMLAAMAETARELGALDTQPATPSGLDGPSA
jgi:D-alanyl-D-alanine carboxypeptidase (penicillin-binding protein 5/6)